VTCRVAGSGPGRPLDPDILALLQIGLHDVPDLVPNPAEFRQNGFLGPGGRGRIGESDVPPADAAEKDRAGFVRPVAEGDDMIEGSAGEFVRGFRSRAGMIDADFGQDAEGGGLLSFGRKDALDSNT